MFDTCDPARGDHATDIHEATEFLLERTIPEFAKSLEEYLFTDTIDPDEFIDLIHRAGINVRYFIAIFIILSIRFTKHII
jgi:hypothetical protein